MIYYLKCFRFYSQIANYKNILDPDFKLNLEKINHFRTKLKINFEGYCDHTTIDNYLNAIKHSNKSSNRKEIVFLGKSNVGKSSLINEIIDMKALETSKLPGKTQKLYFLNLATKKNSLTLIDSPGFGYNTAPSKISNKWPNLMSTYIDKSNYWLRAFLLIDSRKGIDSQIIDLIKHFERKKFFYNFIFTKVDKINNNQKEKLYQDCLTLNKKWLLWSPIIHYTSS